MVLLIPVRQLYPELIKPTRPIRQPADGTLLHIQRRGKLYFINT